jgi:hypothetical protein
VRRCARPIGLLFILEPSELAKAAIGKRVTVIDYPQGWLAIRYRGIELAYRTFDKIRQVDQGAIVENKRLGAALAFIRAEQLRRNPGGAARKRRADTTSTTRVCSRLAEPFSEPSGPGPARQRQRVQFKRVLLRLNESTLQTEHSNIVAFLRTSCDPGDCTSASINRLRLKIERPRSDRNRSVDPFSEVVPCH